jgi:hypothetical protein
MRYATNNATVIIKSAIFLLAIIATSTAFAFAEETINVDGTMDSPKYPSHWGEPPMHQTRDYVKLPEPYGKGSSTLRKWIGLKMEEDAAAATTGEGDNTAERRFADPTTSKWPDKSLVGMTGDEAKKEINDADPSLLVQIIPDGSMMTMDYSESRVRIFVDGDGKVVRQPNKG